MPRLLINIKQLTGRRTEEIYGVHVTKEQFNNDKWMRLAFVSAVLELSPNMQEIRDEDNQLIGMAMTYEGRTNTFLVARGMTDIVDYKTNKLYSLLKEKATRHRGKGGA